jgi:hypothetical protein
MTTGLAPVGSKRAGDMKKSFAEMMKDTPLSRLRRIGDVSGESFPLIPLRSLFICVMRLSARAKEPVRLSCIPASSFSSLSIAFGSRLLSVTLASFHKSSSPCSVSIAFFGLCRMLFCSRFGPHCPTSSFLSNFPLGLVAELKRRFNFSLATPRCFADLPDACDYASISWRLSDTLKDVPRSSVIAAWNTSKDSFSPT